MQQRAASQPDNSKGQIRASWLVEFIDAGGGGWRRRRTMGGGEGKRFSRVSPGVTRRCRETVEEREREKERKAECEKEHEKRKGRRRMRARAEGQSKRHTGVGSIKGVSA